MTTTSQPKKTIVLIDDDATLPEIMAAYLEDLGFETHAFRTFSEAQEYLKEHTPDLILSDMRKHIDDNKSGLEFYLESIIHKRIDFGLWTGLLPTHNIKLFFDGMPHTYRISYDEKQALSQNEVDVLIEDFQTKKITKIPLFLKPANIKDILDFFKMNVNSFVVLYFGTLIEAARLTVEKL